jgi:predicted RNA binding protein YcfA (HicA-like mRNA interferase family)
MKVKQLLKLLEKNGYTKVRQNGSHALYRCPGKKSLIVPVHGSKDLKKGTELKILKDAGLL